MVMRHPHCYVQQLYQYLKIRKKSLNDSSNYRGIALSSTIGKVLDTILLVSNQDILQSSPLQFGFKAQHSTTMCTFALEEVVQYYKNNNSDVYIMLLDASKAFDRVHYVKLFKLLHDRGMCPLVSRLLIMMYTNQSLCVKWGNCLSKYFNATNGVKQGGVLSPILFTAYMDKLLEQLESSGVGCYIGRQFMGAFGYADDVALVSPTLTSLRLLLSVCDDFGREFNVLFNPDKYQLMHYTCNSNKLEGIVYNDIFIKATECGTHLGNPVGPNGPSNAINDGINSFIIQYNSIMSLFPKAHVNVKYTLFKSFGMSLYGCIYYGICLVVILQDFIRNGVNVSVDYL